jgi:hypothetical protein
MRPAVFSLAFLVILSLAPAAEADCYKCAKPWYGGKNWICADTSSGWKYCQLTYGPTGNQCAAWDECGGGMPGVEYPDMRLDERCPLQQPRLFLMYAEAGRETAAPLRLVAAETPARPGS